MINTVLSYPIDLIRLDFVVNGGGVSIIGGVSNGGGVSKIFFYIIFLPILKILLVCLEWLKILKNLLEEDYSIVAPSHILFIYSDFILFFIYRF